MALPVVTTDVTGCRDAVLNHVTGLIVPPRNASALREALAFYLTNKAERSLAGARGRARVLDEFNPERIWGALAELYHSLAADAPATALGAVSTKCSHTPGDR
jgi:glycosyltransferase involved in cell wall biosynthesis